VLIIFICYAIQSKKLRLAALGGWIFNVYFVYMHWRGSFFSWHTAVQNLSGVIVPMTAVLLLAFYNGERGAKFKYLFYFAYPVHLGILFFLQTILNNLGVNFYDV
jgi:hypothetical protein